MHRATLIVLGVLIGVAVLFVSNRIRSDLADAIHDCRAKANALDWEAWNRKTF